MDLPNVATTHLGEGDGEIKVENQKDIELISSTSSDTGFASDETSSPLQEDKDLSVKETKLQSQDKVDDQAESFSQEKMDALSSEKAEEDQPQSMNTNEHPEEKTKTDEYLDILGNGQLRKKVLIPGKGVDTRPNNGDTVTVRLTATLENGKLVEDGETSFILNDGDVVVALDLGVALMEMGEKCELITSSRYAFGDIGREPDVPKDAALTYTLELVDTKPQVDNSKLTFQERLQQGENKRLRGNFLFGRADYSGAINSYTKAVKVLDDTDLNAGLDESDRAQLEEAWTKCYNNMAACQLKIEATDAAIRSAEKVLISQPNNIKALFRIGKAHGVKGEVDKAIMFLKKAIQFDPESKMLHQELFALTKRKHKEAESEKDLYRKMLGLKEDTKSKQVKKNPSKSSFVYKWVLPVGGLAAVVASLGFAWYRTSS